MSADSLTLTFSALSDPTRRAILVRLARGEASVNDLAAPFDVSLPAISKHLSVLERSGLIERRKESRFRPRRLKPANDFRVHPHFVSRFLFVQDGKFQAHGATPVYGGI